MISHIKKALLPLLIGGAAQAQTLDAARAADPTWLLISTALVLLMLPGLGLFYAGLVRRKNVVNTMMMSFGALALVGLSWVLIGYSLAFGGNNAWWGNLEHLLLRGVGFEAVAGVPGLLYAMFHCMFAAVTVAIISGAVIERMNYRAYLLFAALWSALVYAPLAHWVWGGGWLARLGALDFAGGTVVHVNAGVAAAVLVVLLGRRRDYGSPLISPHSVPLSLLGAGLLWFGWFGFNGGSALVAGNSAVLAFANTFIAPAATVGTWLLLDLGRYGRMPAVGFATAVVVGLVAITPASGFVSPVSALVIGVLAALASYFALLWRAGSNFDDSLDVVAAHGVAGLVGALLTGVFADAAWSGGANGLLAGNPAQLLVQLVAVGFTLAWSGAGTFVVVRLVGLLTPLRAQDEAEREGLDLAAHGEQAYIEGA